MTTENIDELKAQGNKAFSSGDYAAAVDLFSQAIALDTSNHVLYSNRSAAYASLKNYTQALADADQCIQINGSWSKGYGRKGAALFGLGRLEEAEKTYSEGMKLDPANTTLSKGLQEVQAAIQQKSNPMGGLGQIFGGDVLAKIAGNPQISKYLADQDYVQKILALQRDPNSLTQCLQDPRIMQTMGALMGINLSTASADKFGDDASSATDSPMQEDAHVEEVKADKPAAAPEPEVAMAEPEPEIPSNVADSKKEKELGNQEYKKKSFEAALVHYDKAWELNQEDITILTNKSAVYFEQGNYDSCIATCEEAVEKGRELRADYKVIAKAYGRIGNAYAKKDDVVNAIKFYEKSLAEHRTADVLDRLRQMEKLKVKAEREAYQNPELAEEARNKGNELFKQGKFADAVQQYTESIKRAESDPRGYSNRSACYMKLMALPDALRDAEKSIELDATFIKGYIRKAAVQYAMKEFTKCMQTCDEALPVDAEHHGGKHRAEIETQKQKASFGMYGVDETADPNETQEQRAQRAMQNPKVQEILSDPVMRAMLEQMSQDPGAAREHMKNPAVREKIQFLASMGVIGMR